MIEGVATVDSRGQIVLPKEARTALDLHAGSKLTVVVMRRGDTPCCINLVPVAPLEEAVRHVINPGETHVN